MCPTCLYYWQVNILWFLDCGGSSSGSTSNYGSIGHKFDSHWELGFFHLFSFLSQSIYGASLNRSLVEVQHNRFSTFYKNEGLAVQLKTKQAEWIGSSGLSLLLYSQVTWNVSKLIGWTSPGPCCWPLPPATTRSPSSVKRPRQLQAASANRLSTSGSIQPSPHLRSKKLSR